MKKLNTLRTSILILAVALTFTVGFKANASSQQESAPAAKAPDIIILSGNPMGSVKFRHILHTDVREIPCVTCHHPSKPQKPASSPTQACGSCHTHVASAPMLTSMQGAFHNPTATAGLCIDCHVRENAAHKYKLAPVKCAQCHSKANVLPDPTAGTSE
jgi:Class III cytochrome C family